MHSLSFILLISFILSALCHTPADYGFTDAGKPGVYTKVVTKDDGTTFKIMMRISPDGKAQFRIVGAAKGRIVGDEMKAEGPAKQGIPISGWEIPSSGQDKAVVAVPPPGYPMPQEAQVVHQVPRKPMTETPPEPGRGFAELLRNPGNTNDGDAKQGSSNGADSNTAGRDDILIQTHQKRGPYYVIQYTKDFDVMDRNKCTEIVEIQGQPATSTRLINGKFEPQCDKDVRRALHWEGDQVLVGGIDQNFLVYGHKDNPNRLIVIQDGTCRINTYTGESSSMKVNELNEVSCEKVTDLLRTVQDELALPLAQRQLLDDENNSKQKLNELVKEFPESSESALDKPTARAQEGDAPPKQMHWLRKFWILIKNFFRKATGRPEKDE